MLIVKLVTACALGGISSGMLAQLTPPTAGTPWAIGVATSIGVIGAAVVHLVGRFQLLSSQAESSREQERMRQETERLDNALQWYRQQVDSLEKRASKAESERDVCQDRLDRLTGRKSSDDIRTSPPGNAPG